MDIAPGTDMVNSIPTTSEQRPAHPHHFHLTEGIHFRFADADARKQGRHVAQWAFGHFLQPVDE